MHKINFNILLVVILAAGVISGIATARGPGIQDIQPEDTIFVYEEGLNLTDLRDQTTNNPVTRLRQYADDDPTKSPINEVTVRDDTDFDAISSYFTNTPATYYAYNPIDGNTAWVWVRKPTVQIAATLANPYHADSIEGKSMPEGTDIAFKITSPDIGESYRVGDTYYASVDVVLTTPGGAEMAVIEGVNLENLLISAPEFYTDDSGYPGPVPLDFRERGEYSVQAKWHSPQVFADNAEDSNIITFSVGDRIGVNETTIPTETVTPTTPPTTEPTTVVTTVPATETIPTPDKTDLQTTATTAPTAPPEPTPAPAGIGAVFGALALGYLLISGIRKN